MNVLILIGKPILIFIIGYLFVRLMKKHSMGTTTPFDFLITVMLGTILAEPIVNKRMEIAFLYATVFTLMHIFMSKLVLWQPARRILTFKPTILISKGWIDEPALARERITISHLLAELRVKGYPNIADVEYAILEETGDISVIPKADKRPLEPADLAMQPSNTGLITALVMDGQIMQTNLENLGKNQAWLIDLLIFHGINKDALTKISLAVLDEAGTLHVDYFNAKRR